MSQQFKSTIQFDIDFDKFKKEYPNLFWLDEVLKLHGFLEVYEFEYVFTVGYQAKGVLPNEEIESMFRLLLETFPWLPDCTKFFDCIELGESKSLMHLFKQQDYDIDFPILIDEALQETSKSHDNNTSNHSHNGSQKRVTQDRLCPLCDKACLFGPKVVPL